MEVKLVVVGNITNEMSVRITNCGLGQFGNLPFTDIYEKKLSINFKK